MKLNKTIIPFILISTISIQGHADPDRLDFDLDDNGLIEINDIHDLNEIRNSLDGTSLYGSSEGCPVTGCIGFELTTDLDFDQNKDGVLDSNDPYWNNGNGWNPIGDTTSSYFKAIFNGNGHSILNLYINRSDLLQSYIGLFGHTDNATITNISITGDLSRISGYKSVGSLIGYASDTQILNASSTSPVKAAGTSSGGLIGTASNSTIQLSYATGDVVTGSWRAGGLVGYISDGTTIAGSFATGDITPSGTNAVFLGGLVGVVSDGYVSNTFATGDVLTSSSGGGLVGALSDGTVSFSFSTGSVTYTSTQPPAGLVGTSYNSADNYINNSYWATDTSGMSVITTGVLSGSTGNAGATLSELQCPVSASNTSCNSATLYLNWSGNTYNDHNNTPVPYWDFGSTDSLPGINIYGVVYRDSDGDGSLDAHDAFPFDHSEDIDTDGDGVGNSADNDDDNDGVSDDEDAFPLDASETTDTDGDGVGDNSDAFVDDASESSDNDGDGIGNNADTDDDNDGVSDDEDAFPLDANESFDTDGDGIGNNADNDDDNDGIEDSNDLFPLDSTGSSSEDIVDANGNGLIDINSLADLDALRHNLDGTHFNGVTAGCPNAQCNGFELTTDLDFDTNGDGVIDENDEYWNEGTGWEPIGSSSAVFASTFNGNGHSIHNLYINRPELTGVGLFGYATDATIINLYLDGSLANVTGHTYVGALAGRLLDTNIRLIASSVNVNANNHGGGIAGYARSTTAVHSIEGSYAGGNVSSIGERSGGIAGHLNNVKIKYSFATGNISGSQYVGGLSGYAYASVLIHSSYATGSVTAQDYAGGLIGFNENTTLTIENSYASGLVDVTNVDASAGGLIGHADNSVISNTYWSTSTGQTQSIGSGIISDSSTGYGAYSIETLSCPVSADNISCATETLFTGWSDETYTTSDLQEVSYWDFGTDTQLPVLTLDGVAIRDSDNDGVIDEYDAFPFDPKKTEDDGSTDGSDDPIIDPDDSTPSTDSAKSSGGGSLFWLLMLAPLVLKRRK